RQLRNPELANQLNGAIQLVAKVNGNQSQGIEHAEATIESARLTFRSQPIENLKVIAGYSLAGIQLDIASAELAGGTVSGFANWRDLAEVSRGVPAAVDFQVNTLGLEELVLVELPVQFGGQASGNLKFGLENRDGRDDWTSTGQLQVSKFKVAGT
ncbi:unnamed protein product, partial [marine sediment metagenome]